MINIKHVLKAVEQQSDNLNTNYKMLDILEGNLEPYLLNGLTRLLSPRVLKYAVERLVPINIVPRYVDKLSNIYQTGVLREVADGTPADEELLSWYQDVLDIDSIMHQSNRLYNACRATLLHPYIGEYGPEIRVIPNDRFVVCSDDLINPTEPTMVILLAGCDAEGRKIYWVYTATEFYVVRSDGTIDYQAMAAMNIPDGVNPYGVLPFIYVNSSNLRLCPYPDKDTIRMAEYVPSALTDLNLAALFASFSITYIKNGEVADPTYAPNALWFLKADDPEKDVEIGTIKPEVSYNDVLNLIQSELSLWLGSKGIKTGSVGALNADSAASGIAKVIDEADTFDVRQAQSVKFGSAEHELWELILEDMHPVWVSQGLVSNRSVFSAGASVSTRFSIIPVGTQRSALIAEQRDEYSAGFTTRTRAISMLNPQLNMNQVADLIQDVDGERSMPGDANVLNGAQVGSAVDILTAAAIGTIPRESAVQLMVQSFGWDIEQANAMLSTIGQGFTPSSVQGNVTINPDKPTAQSIASV